MGAKFLSRWDRIIAIVFFISRKFCPLYLVKFYLWMQGKLTVLNRDPKQSFKHELVFTQRDLLQLLVSYIRSFKNGSILRLCLIVED